MISKIAATIRRWLEPYDQETISLPVPLADNARIVLNEVLSTYVSPDRHLGRCLSELDEAIYAAMVRQGGDPA